MKLDDLYSELTLKTSAKLVLLVLDGLGDIATTEQGFLHPARSRRHPEPRRLVAEGCAQGRMIPVAPGITPGSGPGHLGLFGYDPLEFQVGRGVIEALGLGVELKAGDVCARANFATLDAKGIVTDRRAGRIPTETCEKLCAMLSAKIKKIGDTQVIIKAGKEHRFVVVFRGKGLEGPLTDADPNREGLPIPTVKPRDAKSAKQKKMAKLIADFYKLALPVHRQGEAGQRLPDARHCASAGDSRCSRTATSCKPACSGGLSDVQGPGPAGRHGRRSKARRPSREQFERYLAEYDNYDFFFIHFKYTDKAGEDGNFEAKKKAIEEFDAALPMLLKKQAGCAGHHRRPFDALRGEGPFVASATGVAAFALQRHRTSWSASRRPARTWARWACSRRNTSSA